MDEITAIAMRRALDMISAANTLTLPIDVWRIAAHHRIKMQYYSRTEPLLKLFNLVERAADQCAVCTKRWGEYYIFLSDDLNTERARYVIAHELGHIALDHLGPGATIKPNEGADDQANLFARILLAPPPILEQYDVTCPEGLRHVTGLSLTDSREMYALLEQYRADQHEAERCEDIERRVRYQMKRKRRR